MLTRDVELGEYNISTELLDSHILYGKGHTLWNLYLTVIFGKININYLFPMRKNINYLFCWHENINYFLTDIKIEII